ncbi:MAG: DHH family phosphoesterase [Clostridia bacterium]|nr:DHH family phosphoesterase [Clostridia bacterium]
MENKNLNKKQIWNLIKNISEPVYIAGHLKPDQDSFCSSMALCLTLNKLGKNAKVLLKNSDLSEFLWVNQEIMKLVIENIDENKYCFIALDLNEKKRLGDFEKYFDNAKMTFNIDHHQDNKYEANYTFSNSKTSSTCQMIFEMLEEESLFENDICEMIYAGMLNDTNCFSRRIDDKTLLVAQKLVNFGIDYSKIISETYKSRTMYEVKALSSAVNNIKYCGFHYLIIDKNDECYKNLTHNQIVKKLAEDLRVIDEIKTFIVLIKQDNKIIGKVMTNESDNANKIAELLGGGGHKKEAGFTILNVTVEEIIEIIKNYLLI